MTMNYAAILRSHLHQLINSVHTEGIDEMRVIIHRQVLLYQIQENIWCTLHCIRKFLCSNMKLSTIGIINEIPFTPIGTSYA